MDEAQTILYLRPQSPRSIEAMDLIDNKLCLFELDPPPKSFDERLEVTSNHENEQEENDGSRESSPDRRVLRLTFDSSKKPSPRGFEIGCESSSDVKVPSCSSQPKAHFTIRYNFSSGALLVTALGDFMKVGKTGLKKDSSLVLQQVEFPNLKACAEQHQRNYETYAANAGIIGAVYLQTSQEKRSKIGERHRSVNILGNGSFAVVHRALHIDTADLFAIKVIHSPSKDEEECIREIKIMKSLQHERIIRFVDAF
ncbi:hypothetical protein SBOR_1378 [Sclerotinia borealis F-4128]|uniref:Protein kinase domain-containing protein n=1 Tax=Sclerotinia borealis (strain F-4128) TaxID=1432307 RepID=W9CNA7_SCLBF|nr:hypothetical protein SBOR_1378 [Sclerotinia borealis F-4128]